MLPKPIDIVGDDIKETKKKSTKKPKSQKKKTWSREEILNTFLPPEKQQALQKSKQHRSKTATSEPEKKPAKKPAKKEKKPVPQVVIKEKKEVESPAETDGTVIVGCVTSSQELDHSIHDAVGPHGSQTEVGGESSWIRDLTS